MAGPLQPFESSWQKEIQRKQLREAREQCLDKAKADHDRREKKKEKARERGEGTWMLPSVSDRVDKDEQTVKKRKLKKEKKEKKKKKKNKKEKKSKKAKKKKSKHKDSDESSTDSSDSDSDSEVEWAEKSVTPSEPVAGPKLERQDWMVDPLADIFGGITREQIRDQKKKERGEEEEKPIIDQLGQHDKELNPYWKDGGTGMPDQAPGKKARKAAGGATGDGGLSWLQKARQRCVEAAEEEGRTLEEVAADRYGSLKKLEKMIADAEKKNARPDDSRSGRKWERGSDADRDRQGWRGSSGQGLRGEMSGRFMKPGQMGGSDRERPRRTFAKPGDDLDRDPPKKKFAFMKPGEDAGNGSSGQGWRKKDSRDADNVPRWKKHNADASQDRDSDRNRGRHRDRSRSRSADRSDDRKRDRQRDRSRSRSADRNDDRRRDRQRDRSRSRSRERSGERIRDRNKDQRRDRSRSRDRSMDRDKDRRRGRSRSNDRENKRKRSEERSRSRERQRRHSSSSSSDSTPDSESESESSEPQSESESEPEPEPVKILTEDEMNAIGAKILRAEMMGNDAVATKLKAELEEARKLKASAGAAGIALPGRAVGKPGRAEESVVVLTRTDRAGNVRPLPAAKHEREDGARRRKMQKVSTHAKDGERERYFADDDKHSLKDLVRQEKMTTAEDSNHMFARLAGRVTEKTDEEHQIDDVMVGKANKMMSEAREELRDRASAIAEHMKMKSTLDKCRFCFDNIPKHLIIAIGLKVILCLPEHRSMVPGHCLIVPMHHTASGTAVDDDVWAEVQVFRKGLTAMFREQEEDTVFMETSMHLRRLPHMVVEVIPMPRETGEMAPIYFKKAIQESDTEWAQNKKLIDLSKKNVRHSVPKGFPYFSVDFGLQGGFAHVIEDEQIFPGYFGREICGGMMDVEPNLWRKPHKEDFELQRQKVLRFAAWWKPYDWTQKLKTAEESDSD